MHESVHTTSVREQQGSIHSKEVEDTKRVNEDKRNTSKIPPRSLLPEALYDSLN